MGILASLLGRMGYTKLGAYGLIQTPEGRIAMVNPRVLDDGFGGRIVGWRPEDTAPLELTPLELVPRGAAGPVASARAEGIGFAPTIPMPPLVAPQPARAPIAMPIAAPPIVAAPIAAPIPAPPAPAVAADSEPGDTDEWEWQVAMARARAAAETAITAATTG
ncbi:MAG: hypothetical protein K8W52_22985, partial [Deltaproteobacteria bacterium]|nr:hypothetical protein [Deltaproteobacteria bacterium]